MLPQYWMVLINSIIALSVLSFFLIFIKFFPRKKINYYYLLGIASILPVISIFRKGVYESGDFVYHLYRAIAFDTSLREGILIPSWAGRLNGGFGYPVFIFIYNIPYYALSLIHLLGFSWITSEKILLAVIFIVSGFTMFIFLKKLVKDEMAAFTGSIVYLFSPYHLVDLHFRVALAELIAFVIAPIVFLLALKIFERPRLIFTLWLGLTLGILFLDHPPMFIFYSTLLFLYSAFKVFTKEAKTKTIAYILASLCLGLTVSSYAWIARITLTTFTHGANLAKSVVLFVNPQDIIVSPWRLGFLFQGHKGELSFIIGYTEIAAIIIILFFVLRGAFNTKTARHLKFWLASITTMIFLMTPASYFIWKTIPLVNLMQFSYRFLHPIAFAVAIITAYFFLRFPKRKLVFVFIVLTIGYTMLNWGNRGMVQGIDDAKISKSLEKSTQEGEGMIEGNPIWWNSPNEFWIKEIPEQRLTIIDGDADVIELRRTSTIHIYSVMVTEAATILENTFYFPGWTVRANEREIPIQYQNEKYPARIVFELPKGKYLVEVKYSDIPAMDYAKTVSFTTVIIIGLLTLKYLSKK